MTGPGASNFHLPQGDLGLGGGGGISSLRSWHPGAVQGP